MYYIIVANLGIVKGEREVVAAAAASVVVSEEP